MMLLVLAGWIVWTDYIAPKVSVADVQPPAPVADTADAQLSKHASPAPQSAAPSREPANPERSGSESAISKPPISQPPVSAAPLTDPTRFEPEFPELPEQPAPIPNSMASAPELPGERTVSAAEMHQFRVQISTVLDLLGQRQLDSAGQKIDSLLPMAVTETQCQQVAGLQQLHEAVGHFWAAYRDGYTGLAAGRELTIGRTTGVVVEATPDRLVVRVLGRNRHYDPATMPLKLARIIAEQWFDTEAPSTAIHIGAVLYVDPDGDRTEAAALWKKARQQGQDIDALMGLLDRMPLNGQASQDEDVDRNECLDRMRGGHDQNPKEPTNQAPQPEAFDTAPPACIRTETDQCAQDTRHATGQDINSCDRAWIYL